MQIESERFSWYQVSSEVKDLLISAAAHWNNPNESEKYINEALAKTSDNLDVLVTAYRYFVYTHKYPQARQTAQQVIDKIKQTENLPENWQHLKPILLNRSSEPPIRLYLNAYAALGFILARMGEIELAKQVTARVKEVDAKNEFGASVVWDILTRPPEED